jgi:D-alanine-D-alanine ligase-like ATP-grasp enzyme
VKHLNHITFVDALRGAPDRGWSCEDASAVLTGYGIGCDVIHVRSPADLEAQIAHSAPSLFWPLTFTFDGDPASSSIAMALSSLGRAYVGCDAATVALTSKLKFKAALAAAGVPTPHHLAIDAVDKAYGEFTYPAFLKADYSCDSDGVRYVRTASEFSAALGDLLPRFARGLYLESIAGSTEWTVACIMIGSHSVVASLGLRAKEASFIDTAAKADNSLLHISIPQPAERRELATFVQHIAERLKLTGYFRLDVLTTPLGSIMPIDLNLLPHLNNGVGHLSYMPMALMLETGCSYEEVLAAAIASSGGFTTAVKTGSELHRFVSASRLVRRAVQELRSL